MSRGPSRKSAVFQYFKLNEDESIFICQVEKDGKECNAKISAYTGKHANAPTRASNLKRHLRNKHPNIYKVVDQHDKEIQKPTSSQASTSISKSKQVSVTKFFHSERITISMTKKNFKKYLIDLVVKNGVALTLFSSPAFRGLNGEMAAKLGVSLERHDIRNMILKEAESQKTLLKTMLQGKFFFLKMDACTRQRINYMAINVQFIDDEGKLVIRTLAVKDTEAQHSSEYLTKLIETILTEYEITKEQILSIVTDNASNMTSTVQKLNDGEVKGDLFEDSSEEDTDETADKLDSVDTVDNDFAGFSNIPHMRCAVHTLQLAIRDGLKERNAANVVGRLRNIVVAARMPKLDAILKRRSGKGAVIDQATRWGSTYEMIKRLLELKPYLIDMANPDVTMTDIQWQQASQLEALLKYPYVVTKKFQAAELTPGTFYKEWKNINYKLSQIGGIVADGIRMSMQRREENLLNNDVLLAAVYVDPMHRVLLTEEQIARGKSALCDVAVRMKMLNETDAASNSEFESCSSPAIMQSSCSNSEEEMDFEKYLDNEEKSKKVKRCRLSQDDKPIKITPLTKFREDFNAALIKIEKFDRSLKLDVMNAIPKYPELVQDVARTVTALPPTQVSVERLFSALRLIKSHLRAKLKEDIIDAILFLRTNSP